MPKPRAASALLTVRIGPSLARALDREALRRRDTRSQVARSILEEGLRRSGPGPDPADEARRQSLLVSRRRSERETIEFVARAADTRGWR